MVIIAMTLLLLCPKTAAAQEDSTAVNRLDSIEISLLTCGPFDQIYALYGHTGLRINDMASGQDIVANWGIFDMTQKFFAVKFAFGITDYRMAFEPMDEFVYRYRYYGTYMTEQVLNLSAKEKQQIIDAVNENARPENLYYRYNYFYDNCTTRVRDIIASGVDGKVEYPEAKTTNSFRTMIHQWTGSRRWEAWGQDFLLGLGADKPTTRSEQQFLPDSLREDYDHAFIIAPDGTRKPMVKEVRYPIPMDETHVHKLGFWNNYLSPVTVLFLLILACAQVFVIEKRKGKQFWQFDAALLSVLGAIGLILFAMIFSQHPTVSLNLQILIFNPLDLLFIVPIIRAKRNGRRSWQAIAITAMLYIALVMGFWQHFAESVWPLALLLIVVFTTRLLYFKNQNETK